MQRYQIDCRFIVGSGAVRWALVEQFVDEF
jgi:hypothetical protein